MVQSQDATSNLLTTCGTVSISPLLRELIDSAVAVKQSYTPNSRDVRLMRLLLDELHALPTLQLHLPLPADPRILRICRVLEAHVNDPATLPIFAERLGIDIKTIRTRSINPGFESRRVT